MLIFAVSKYEKSWIVLELREGVLYLEYNLMRGLERGSGH